jgi:hypothetical protein
MINTIDMIGEPATCSFLILTVTAVVAGIAFLITLPKQSVISKIFTTLLASVLVLGLAFAPIVKADDDSKESQDKKDKHTSNLFQTENFLHVPNKNCLIPYKQW